KDKEVPEISTIFFAGFSSIVKYFMYKQKIRVGKKTGNTALIADAKDSRNDGKRAVNCDRIWQQRTMPTSYSLCVT
ncbi:MAG: hypothetical protein RR291_05755, partial [Clostridia bacterium]